MVEGASHAGRWSCAQQRDATAQNGYESQQTSITQSPAATQTVSGMVGVLARQCLKRRIPDQPSLKREVAAWEARRNTAEATVQWRFTTADARIKLAKLYPTIELIK